MKRPVVPSPSAAEAARTDRPVTEIAMVVYVPVQPTLPEQPGTFGDAVPLALWSPFLPVRPVPGERKNVGYWTPYAKRVQGARTLNTVGLVLAADGCYHRAGCDYLDGVCLDQGATERVITARVCALLDAARSGDTAAVDAAARALSEDIYPLGMVDYATTTGCRVRALLPRKQESA